MIEESAALCEAFFLGDSGPFEHWPPYNGVPYKPMPTAIVRICTNEGMLIAADGLETNPNLEPTQVDLQKIYPILNCSSAYAIFGYTIPGSRTINLIEEAKKSADLLEGTDFDDLALYAEHFSWPIQKLLQSKREDGSIPYFGPGEERGEPGNTILHIFFFGYIQGVASTVDLRFFHRNSIPSTPSITSVDMKIGRPAWIRGSEVVAEYLFDSKDERFSAYRKCIPDDWKNISISQASEIARDYILACESDIGREVDNVICRQIGGRIHIAKITPSEGFQWITRPRI
jgi:hypothetical protein